MILFELLCLVFSCTGMMARALCFSVFLHRRKFNIVLTVEFQDCYWQKEKAKDTRFFSMLFIECEIKHSFVRFVGKCCFFLK